MAVLVHVVLLDLQLNVYLVTVIQEKGAVRFLFYEPRCRGGREMEL